MAGWSGMVSATTSKVSANVNGRFPMAPDARRAFSDVPNLTGCQMFGWSGMTADTKGNW